MLGLGRSFQAERENECFEELLLTPGDRESLYFGKLTGNILFMVLAEAMILPLFAVLYNLEIWRALGDPHAIAFGNLSLGQQAALEGDGVRARVLLEDAITPLREEGQKFGVGYAAYDERLERKVAIKLVRRSASTAVHADERLLREAKAMAQLSHPNVIQVYDVDVCDDRVYIAMEYVRGVTLRRWLEQVAHLGPRARLRAVLRQFLATGAGLQAAHEAGLVHRDFKPDNAIVGHEGRVRVLDFGLARTGEIESTKELELQTVLPSPNDDVLGAPLTHAGSVMGTLAYMAPQHMITTMELDKITSQVEAIRLAELNERGGDFPGDRHQQTGSDGQGNYGEFESTSTEAVYGYEIHMGGSRSDGACQPLFRIVKRNGRPADQLDGLITADGRVWGTYIHGVFDNDAFRHDFLAGLRRKFGASAELSATAEVFQFRQWREKQYDRLAAHVRQHCRVDTIYRSMEL